MGVWRKAGGKKKERKKKDFFTDITESNKTLLPVTYEICLARILGLKNAPQKKDTVFTHPMELPKNSSSDRRSGSQMSNKEKCCHVWPMPSCRVNLNPDTKALPNLILAPSKIEQNKISARLAHLLSLIMNSHV